MTLPSLTERARDATSPSPMPMDVCPQANRPARSRRARATDGGDPLVDLRGVEVGQCSGGGPEQVEVRGPSDWQHLREAPQRLGGRAPRGGGAPGALSCVSKEPARWQSSSIEITPSACQSFSRSHLKRFTSESRTRRCEPARNDSKAPQSIMRRTVENERSRITPTWRGKGRRVRLPWQRRSCAAFRQDSLHPLVTAQRVGTLLHRAAREAAVDEPSAAAGKSHFMRAPSTMTGGFSRSAGPHDVRPPSA